MSSDYVFYDTCKSKFIDINMKKNFYFYSYTTFKKYIILNIFALMDKNNTILNGMSSDYVFYDTFKSKFIDINIKKEFLFLFIYNILKIYHFTYFCPLGQKYDKI